MGSERQKQTRVKSQYDAAVTSASRGEKLLHKMCHISGINPSTVI